MSSVDHSQRAHSDLGASSSKRWFTCPASIPLSEGLVQESSVYAEEGTAAHEVCEMALEGQTTAESFIGETVNGFEVTEEMAEAVQVYVDEVNRRAGAESDVSIEQRFSLDWIDPELFGTNDCAIYDNMGTLTILDYKHGRGVAVEARDNPQLLYYALGAARGLELSEIRLVIVQPRCDHPDGPIREWIVGPKKLAEFEAELKERVTVVNEAREAFNSIGKQDTFYDDYSQAGDHCKFCNAAGFCKTLKAKSLEVASAEFADTPIQLPVIDFLTNEELGQVLQKAGMVEDWIKQVRSYAKSQADLGKPPTGFKLVNKRSNRKWKNEKLVIKEFGPMFGDDLFTKKIRSPAQLEKIVGKKEVSQMTETPPTGTTLVPETDKRKSVLPNAISDFTDI